MRVTNKYTLMAARNTRTMKGPGQRSENNIDSYAHFIFIFILRKIIWQYLNFWQKQIIFHNVIVKRLGLGLGLGMGMESQEMTV